MAQPSSPWARAMRENNRLREAGDRIVALCSRISDQATAEQFAEHQRFVETITRIWNEAKRGEG
jgi:hypothetical protein